MPTVVQGSERTDAHADSERAAGPGGPHAAPIRVLFADDSAAVRTLGRYWLPASQGFAVVAEAADGAEAVALVARHRPDCVVLDIEMPRMGGFEALEVLQHRFPAVRVVMLSGYSSSDMVDRALASGASGYLDKTTQIGELAETVRQVCANRPAVASDAVDADPARRPAAPAPADPAPAVAAPPPASAAVVDAVAVADTAGPPATRSVEDELRRFEYVVSHDLAAPLRTMGGFATLLSTRYGSSLDDSGRLFLSHLVDGAARMQEMIDDLLVYSRAGRAEVSLRDVDLAGAVAAAFDNLRSRLEQAGARTSVGDLPTAVADPQLLDTVLRQLTLNAIIFNTAETPTVHVEGRAADGLAVIEVTDNGIGIPPGDRGRVLELFQRLNTQAEYPGTGTGLALCRRLLELQGGGISVDSAPHGGTVVTVTLPAATAG